MRGRTVTNIDNMDPKLAVLAENGLDYPNLWNEKLNEELYAGEFQSTSVPEIVRVKIPSNLGVINRVKEIGSPTDNEHALTIIGSILGLS